MTLLPSATDFSTVESTNESLSACGRKTPAASNKGSATLATEGARPAIGSPFRTLFPFAVAVLKWCPRAVSAGSASPCSAGPPLFFLGPAPRPPPPQKPLGVRAGPAGGKTKQSHGAGRARRR